MVETLEREVDLQRQRKSCGLPFWLSLVVVGLPFLCLLDLLEIEMCLRSSLLWALSGISLGSALIAYSESDAEKRSSTRSKSIRVQRRNGKSMTVPF